MIYNLELIKNHRLEGERIVLRPVSLEDAEAMFEYTSDEATTAYIFDKHETIERTHKMIANYYMHEAIGKYAIALKDSNKLIGVIEFRVHEDTKSGEIGYIVNSRYWGNGYATEAGKLILDLAFNKLQLNRVFAGHDMNNVASGKVLLRLGMTHEGVLRKSKLVKGQIVDSVNYSILKEEYEQLQ